MQLAYGTSQWSLEFDKDERVRDRGAITVASMGE